MADRLFVYGTLRNDSRNPMFRLLGRDARFVGYGRVQGRLFQLGAYPGLVPSNEAGSWVYGELYLLENPAALARLDDYEGCGGDPANPPEFERVERVVVLEAGGSESAWVYVYNGSTTDKQRISSGDYLQQAPP